MNRLWGTVFVLVVVLIVTTSGIVSGRAVNAEPDPTGLSNFLNASAQLLESKPNTSSGPSTDVENIEFVRQIGGTKTAVAVQGGYAYIAELDQLSILDVSNPANPIVVGTSPQIPFGIKDVAVEGDYAYVLNIGRSLFIIDISDPAAPQTTSSYFINAGSLSSVSLFVAGNYVYIASDYYGLHIIDVANPSDPQEIGFLDIPGESIYDVVVAGDHAYALDTSNNRLNIIDVTNPSQPNLVGFYDTMSFTYMVSGDYLYIGEDNGLRIVNIANPSVPIETGFVATLERVQNVVVAGTYAYVTDWPGTLTVINVADPTQPIVLGQLSLPLYGIDEIAVDGSYAYVLSNGLHIVDVTSPITPTWVGLYDTPTSAMAVAVAGNYVYALYDTDGLHIYNVANPNQLYEVGAFELWGYGRDVIVANNYAYVVTRDGGLQIINVVNPSNPLEIGSYPPPIGCDSYSVTVEGDLAFLATECGLHILNVAEPATPTEIGGFQMPEWGVATDVAVAGNFAYVVDYWEGLRIINVANPAEPIETAFFSRGPGSDSIRGIEVVGNYAYWADGDNLRIFSIANPAAPTEVSSFDGPLYAEGVTVVDDYVYLLDRTGLVIINVADPIVPVEVGSYYSFMRGDGSLAVSENYIYIAAGESGLKILRHSSPHTISGRVLDQSGTPVSGVLIGIPGGPSATTNAQGRYTITGVTAGTKTLTPSKAGIVFSPASRTISVNGNTSGIDFRATSGGAVDLSAYALEVTQGIQDLNNSVRLVAGKRTFVRFYAESNGGLYATTATLTARKGTQEVTIKPTRIIADPVGPRANLNRGLLTQGFLFELPDGFRSGSVSLTATVNPGPTRDPAEINYANNSIEKENLPFEEVPPLDLVVFSLGYLKDGNLYYPEWWEPQQMVDWLRSAYPVSQINVRWRTEIYHRKNWFGGPTEYPYPDTSGVNFFLLDLRKDMAKNGSAGTRYFALVDDGGMPPDNRVKGAALKIIAEVGWARTGVPGTSSHYRDSWANDGSYGDFYGGHELGHMYGLNHYLCPTPDLVVEGLQPEIYIEQPQGYNPNGRISPTVNGADRTAVYGLRVRSDDQLEVMPPSWYDMMTYCQRVWISQPSYEKLLDYFKNNLAAAPADSANREAGSASATTSDRYLITGLIHPATNEAELHPIFVIPNVSLPETRVPGDYAIVLYGSGGGELARYPFTPVDGTSGLSAGSDSLLFSELVPVADGTTRINIEDASHILTTVQAGLQAPTVQLITPNGGELPANESVTVTWTASDGDSDPLIFDIDYSSDNGGTWMTVAQGIVGTTATIDSAGLPGSSQGRFRVWATDGINTSIDASDSPVSVANHVPALTISTPTSDEIIASGQTLTLQAEAYDFDDGVVSETNVEWRSDIDGLLGTGSLLVISSPSVGSHTITARATDSAGISVEQSVNVTVVATDGEVPLPADGLLVAPENVSIDVSADPLSQSIVISNENAGHFVTWNASADRPWVNLETSTGMTPGNLVFSIDTQGVEPGVYSGQITITSPDLPGTEHVVDITMTVPTLYSISGNVSEDIGFPMEGALVIDSSGAETYTDENGDYVLTGLQPGVHEVEVFYNDYEFTNNPITVTVPPDAVDIDFVGTFVGLNVLLIEPMADAYVDEASKTANFGTKPYLRVKNATTDNNTYLKFEVSGLSCAAIESVGLSLFTKDPGPDGGSVYSTGINWTETGITWNNAPAISGTALGNFGAVVDESWEHVSLANAVTGDGIYSFAVRSNSSNLVEYSSGEGAYPGRLQIEYRPLPAVVPAADFLADHTSGFSPLTVNFQDTASGCPTSWLWDFGDGTTSTAQHPSHVYASPGTYEVSLTVSNGKGSDTETKTGYITVEAPPPEPDYYISPSGSATIGGFPSTPADILRYTKSTNTWAMVYDGSVRGTAKNVSAFDILDDGSLLLVFGANQVIAGLGTATAYDVVRFTPNTPGVYPLGTGTYSWFFQGRTPGLTTTTEKIDALDFDAAGNRLLLSTAGAANVILPDGTALKPADEDVFVFNRSTNQWESPLVIDGSNMTGMAVEDITSIWDDPASGDYYITITGSFNLGGVKGNSKSIVKLTPNGGATVFTPSLVPWLAPGATFPSNLDGLTLRN